MLGLEALVALIVKHGLLILAPIAVIEGPIVTVIAAWLASQNILDLWSVIVIVMLANVVGDLGRYAIGRWGINRMPESWLDRMGLNRLRLRVIARHFRRHGVRTLLMGKATQVVIGPVLVAAGVARMPVWKFVWVTFIGTVPTSLIYVAVGYIFGSAYQQIDNWIGRATLVGIVVVGLAALVYWQRKRAARSE